jgi:hypothetical protein
MAEPVRPISDSQRRPDPDEKLVKVFDSEQETEALVVKGLLDSAGIDNDLTSAAMLQDMFPGLGGTIILVREEDAEKARSLIAEQLKSSLAASPDDDETAELEIISDPDSNPEADPPRKA